MHYLFIYIETYSNYFLLVLTIVVKSMLINNTKNYVLNLKTKNIMKKINPNQLILIFKYSILISLHYYDIFFHPERISKLNRI